ncbi:MAG: hypothetical protein J6M53_07110 [Bacteroidaceae bacterium]|nr:hypothetical protein [Bacteroidaceae bacterium]
MYPTTILEEQLKNEVARDLFPRFDTTQIVGRVDFCVCLPADPLGLNEPEPLLWAEAKRGTSHDIFESVIQLILTLGKERPQDRHLPPAYLGAFDAEKIAFLPYSTVLPVLRQNDFNWNVPPSDHHTKEFRQLLGLLHDSLHSGLEIYRYDTDAPELFHFIRRNFATRSKAGSHIRINRNNFTHIYLKWLQAVKPTINIDWDLAKQAGIIDADFYLADILAKDNQTLGEKLFVLLQDDHYLLDRRVNDLGLEELTRVRFNDRQQAHRLFWNRYARPPRREYWDDIVNRRDLLVPQDVRERKGSFFTPARWVELSQQYIAAELGENWQDEYYIWDCCAGTGNLLAGLTNKYHVYASTLDKADVQAIHQRIAAMNAAARTPGSGGANLLESHVFQFDFLNDPFTRLPQSLQDIINDPERRRHLIIYINPPYAEAGTATQVTGGGENKTGVSNTSSVWETYRKDFGLGIRELYVQFFARIYSEIPSCCLAEFSTLKILQGSAFAYFRNWFKAKLCRMFVVPAATFDNVKGQFPIGFFIWRTDQQEVFQSITADVYDADGTFLGNKTISSTTPDAAITKWITRYVSRTPKNVIGYTGNNGPDFQNNQYLCIQSEQSLLKSGNPKNACKYAITPENLIPMAVYFSARLCNPATWLNDRDQFLYPSDGWQTDYGFQADCLVYTLFHGQNRISAESGENHWLPFTEEEVGAQEVFQSHFMSDFLRQPLRDVQSASTASPDLFSSASAEDEVLKARQTTGRGGMSEANGTPVNASTEASPEGATDKPDVPRLSLLDCMSEEARAVYAAGLALWRYYHAQPAARQHPDASFYDIRLHFQGTKTTKSGKQQMNPDSPDACYTALIRTLRAALKELAQTRLAPKVYQYGFLKE